MLESREEFDALTETLNTSGWAIFKRLSQEEIKKAFKSAKNTTDKDIAYVELQKYKAIEELIQKPYHILNESEFKKEGEI